MVYRVHSIATEPPLDALEDADWVEHTESGYRFDFEPEPLFGSPTRYKGVFVFTDRFFVIGRAESSSKLTRVLDRLEDAAGEKTLFEDVEFSPGEQHELVNAYDGYATRLSHPEHPETRVSEIARMESLRTDSDVTSYDVRDEGREEQYPIHAGAIRKDGDTVSFDLDGTLSVSDLPTADLETAMWVGEVVESIRA